MACGLRVAALGIGPAIAYCAGLSARRLAWDRPGRRLEYIATHCSFMSKLRNLLTTCAFLFLLLAVGCGGRKSTAVTVESQGQQPPGTDDDPLAEGGALADEDGDPEAEEPSGESDEEEEPSDTDSGSLEIIEQQNDLTPDVLGGVGDNGAVPDDEVPFEDPSVPIEEVEPPVDDEEEFFEEEPEEEVPEEPGESAGGEQGAGTGGEAAGTGGEQGEGTGGETASTGGAQSEEPPTFEAPNLPALRALGRNVFFDSISDPDGMACASCHAPEAGWTEPDGVINLGQVASLGAFPGRSGVRKAPTIAYASFSPRFGNVRTTTDCIGSTSVNGAACRGGLMWDGRATGGFIGASVFGGDEALQSAYGEFLGPIADQVLGPFTNPLEHNLPSQDADNGLSGALFVCEHVASASYVNLYGRAWGALPDCANSAELVFKRIAVAVAAWESSAEVNSFSSRRDQAIANDGDDNPGEVPFANFSDAENLGHALFFGLTTALNPTGKNARCSACHNSRGSSSRGNEAGQLYTDYGFHHLGLPPNFEIANFSRTRPDRGLTEHTFPDASGAVGHDGHFKTPTLRNVAKHEPGVTRAYMHNGYFKTLEDVVHFYNTATLKLNPTACPAGTTAAEARARGCWPAAEINNGRQASRGGAFGDLGLTAAEEAALVAYLRTLDDEREIVRPGTDVQ